MRYISVPNDNEPRSNVKAIFDSVETDLKTALNILNDNNNSSSALFKGKFYFNKLALNGILSRFYLDKGLPDSVIKYSQNVLAENSSLMNKKYGMVQARYKQYPQLMFPQIIHLI